MLGQLHLLEGSGAEWRAGKAPQPWTWSGLEGEAASDAGAGDVGSWRMVAYPRVGTEIGDSGWETWNTSSGKAW